MSLSTHLQGSAGEHLVLSDLSALGYHCSLSSPSARYDVVVDVGSKLFRLQVKTCAQATPRSGKANTRYTFYTISKRYNSQGIQQSRLTANCADMLACVAFDIKQVAYIPILAQTPREINFCPPRSVFTSPQPHTKHIEDFPFSKALEALTKENS